MSKDKSEQTVFLLRPSMGGLGSDLTIETEDRQIHYYVRSKLFTPLSRTSTVTNTRSEEIFYTKQENTAIFPCHTIFRGQIPVCKVRQAGVIPQKYIVEIRAGSTLSIEIGAFSSIYKLTDVKTGNVAAEIAQHRNLWLAVVTLDKSAPLLLTAISIIFRESVMG